MPFDYRTDKLAGEAVLRRVCVSAHVDGIRFGPVPQLLFSDPETGPLPVQGQVYLNLASTWRIYAARPEALPRSEDDIDEPEEAEALRQLCELREAVVKDVELGHDAPHLLITFEDGRVFFLNGAHAQYETWQFGIAFARGVGALVVACPGNEVAVWSLPEPSQVAPAV